MSMRIGMCRNVDTDSGASAGYIVRLEVSAERLGALTHRDHAQTSAGAVVGFRARRVDADAVVGDGQHAVTIQVLELDLHASRACVLGDVRERLLRDAKERDLRLRRRPL